MNEYVVENREWILIVTEKDIRILDKNRSTNEVKGMMKFNYDEIEYIHYDPSKNFNHGSIVIRSKNGESASLFYEYELQVMITDAMQLIHLYEKGKWNELQVKRIMESRGTREERSKTLKKRTPIVILAAILGFTLFLISPIVFDDMFLTSKDKFYRMISEDVPGNVEILHVEYNGDKSKAKVDYEIGNGASLGDYGGVMSAVFSKVGNEWYMDTNKQFIKDGDW